MKINIGKIDRLTRITSGGLLFLAFLEGVIFGPLAILALLVAAILIGTAILGTCPLYTKLGWNTIEK